MATSSRRIRWMRCSNVSIAECTVCNCGLQEFVPLLDHAIRLPRRQSPGSAGRQPYHRRGIREFVLYFDVAQAEWLDPPAKPPQRDVADGSQWQAPGVHAGVEDQPPGYQGEDTAGLERGDERPAKGAEVFVRGQVAAL